MKRYSELIKLPTFEDRFNYLKLDGKIGEMTFGGNRYLNQRLYSDPEWKRVRNHVISRDRACDLAHPDYEMNSYVYIHHINPITKEDILNRSRKVFDPDNLVCVSFNTHQAIHYGSIDMVLNKAPVERKPNDTIPWRS